jgi:hypothetical protein
MQFNGLFLTQNRKFSVSISTPAVNAATTITLKSAHGEMGFTGHVLSWAQLEREMISLARIMGASDDVDVCALARRIGGTR